MTKHKSVAIFLSDRLAALLGKVYVGSALKTPKLRIYLQGGGCAGMQYKFVLGGAEGRDDLVFDIKGIHLIIDCFSFLYLKGSLVDYQPKGKGFCLLVHNPNAATSCDCGTSFHPLLVRN